MAAAYRLFRGARAGLGVGLGEKSGGVVATARFVGGGRVGGFAPHPAVGPEPRLQAARTPDRRSSGDAVDRTNCVPHRQVPAESDRRSS